MENKNKVIKFRKTLEGVQFNARNLTAQQLAEDIVRKIRDLAKSKEGIERLAMLNEYINSTNYGIGRISFNSGEESQQRLCSDAESGKKKTSMSFITYNSKDVDASMARVLGAQIIEKVKVLGVSNASKEQLALFGELVSGNYIVGKMTENKVVFCEDVVRDGGEGKQN